MGHWPRYPHAREAIFSLQPITFRYKKKLDPACTTQFGLVAAEVAMVDPDLVARDEDGKPYTVRYDAVNAMLLNEFLRARRQIDAQQRQIEALTAGLQKVSRATGPEQVCSAKRSEQSLGIGGIEVRAGSNLVSKIGVGVESQR